VKKKEAKRIERKRKSDKKREKEKEPNAFSICTAKRGTYSLLSLRLPFLSFVLFFGLSCFPTTAILRALSLCLSLALSLSPPPLLPLWLPCCGCFLFFSFSLSHTLCFVSHRLRSGSVGVFLEYLMDVNGSPKSPSLPFQSVAAAASSRRPFGTPLVF
jgi:hypothetical protein